MRALDTIHRNATAQVQIVNDLLDVSRIVRGNVQLSPTADVARTAADAGRRIDCADGRGQRREHRHVARLEPVFVWADHDRLQQVFWNLLSNAVKFTPSGGRVDVRIDSEGSDVARRRGRHRQRHRRRRSSPRLRAIPPGRRQLDAHARRPRARPGDRAGTSSSCTAAGMTAESEGEGKGSTFTVYLPGREAEQRPAPAVARRAAPARPQGRSRGHAHLIVDDEPDARELLRVMLADTGARISEAESAAEAPSHRIGGSARHHPRRRGDARPGRLALMRAIRGSPPARRARASHRGVRVRAARRPAARAEGRLQRSCLQAGAARRLCSTRSNACGSRRATVALTTSGPDARVHKVPAES